METILRRDRGIVLAGLAGITTIAWTYMFYLAWQMEGVDPNMAMPNMQSWSALDFFLMFLMWGVMMVAMMVPSVTPMVLMFATSNRKRRENDGSFVPTGVFVLGYLVVWSVFSIAATAAQWGLHAASLLSPMMSTNTPMLGGLLLIIAGVFQWSPMKDTCLSHCKSPLGFIMTHWREGPWGGVLMGLRHGAYCVGCCWALMALLFVNGVMNLLWVAVLAAFVLMEKVVKGSWFSRVTGVLLVAWGVFILVTAFSA